MTTINMTQTCKQQNITTFSRTRGGWMKQIEGYDNTQHGGYRFIGSNFIKVGNYDTEIPNGLYLDCSKHFNKEEDKVTEIINLFNIQNGNITLINTIPKSTKGWANKLEKDVNNYFASEDITVHEIIKTIRELTSNQELLQQVARELTKDNTNGKIWLNETHFRAYMVESNVYNANYELRDKKVQETAVKLHNNDHKAIEYFDYNITNDHQVRLLYSLITEHIILKKYSKYNIIFENITEDYYLNTKHLKELREYNRNDIFEKGALHDRGYYVTFNGKYSNTKTVYIIVPNVPEKTIKIQKLELNL